MKIREYNEGREVEIGILEDYYSCVRNDPSLCDRQVILAFNEGGHNSVRIDLLDIIDWVKENRPELLK